MRFCLLTVLFAFATVPFANLATHLASRWDNMRVKHTWHVAPANWETLGHPPPDTTIDLHIALKPHRETAMTDALYEVSDPGHPKCVLLPLFRSRLYLPASFSDMVHIYLGSRLLS